MKPWHFVLLFGLFTTTHCAKHTAGPVFLKAKLLTLHDPSCGMPLVNFSQDSVAARAITHNASLTYMALELPVKDSILNQTILLSITNPGLLEMVACNAMYIIYPSVRVIDSQ